jgi:hypothetical protein
MVQRDNGYRGIWYANQPQDDQYKFKYNGARDRASGDCRLIDRTVWRANAYYGIAGMFYCRMDMGSAGDAVEMEHGRCR